MKKLYNDTCVLPWLLFLALWFVATFNWGQSWLWWWGRTTTYYDQKYIIRNRSGFHCNFMFTSRYIHFWLMINYKLYAGHETARSTLAFTFYLLTVNPAVQEKLFQEIDQFYSRNPVCMVQWIYMYNNDYNRTVLCWRLLSRLNMLIW